VPNRRLERARRGPLPTAGSCGVSRALWQGTGAVV
jgi:hypothetical protein